MKEIITERRRVYASELKARLGVGDTWLRQLEKRGKIPPARKDEGGKRKYWLSDEAEAIVRGPA
jgi:DNA-binding transcriptional MerR regulator